VEKKTRSGCAALETIDSRIVVLTGAATVGGFSDPSALAVNVAGRTAVAVPLEGATVGVVAAEVLAVEVATGAVAVCCAVPDCDPELHPARGRTEAMTPRTNTTLRRLIDSLSAADKWSSEA
jgi:hypothetical protein